MHLPMPYPAMLPPRRSGLRHDLISQILHAIFRGELRAGHRLVVQKIAEQFGVSATPAREALLELTSLGMVDMLPNRGAVVRPFGRVQLAEIYQTRRILETEATRCASHNVDEHEFRAIERELVELQASQPGPMFTATATDIDRRLHELIAVACGNLRLADEIRRYNTLVQAARDLVHAHHPAQMETIAQHLQIVEALLARDEQAAAHAMSQHIQRAEQLAAWALFSQRES